MNSSERAIEVIKVYNRLSGNRGTWESHWEEIAQRMIPGHTASFSGRGIYGNQGAKQTQHIFDSTAVIALNRFSAILDSLLTPRNQTWHRLMASDTALNRDYQVRLWFDEVNRLLFKHRYAPKANFASQNQAQYHSLGAFGTGAMYIDELHNEPGLRYRNVHLGEIYFGENHQGTVDMAVRHFTLTARQAVQMFKKGLPESIQKAASVSPDREYFFIHLVEPRTDRDPERKDFKGMPFASYYVSVEGQALLSEEGYVTFPYAISRYLQSPGEIYGRSPAMEVLPAVKTLNEQKKTVLKQGQRAVDPVLLVHDDGILDNFSMKPGAANAGAVSAEGRALVHTLPVGNIAVGNDMMDKERAVINDAFLITVFQILMETPQMTATEVMERTREKGILLAPTIGRQQSEYLGPMIEREIDVLSRQGLLPPMPGALLEAQGEYRIEYDSPLSRAQRAEEAAGLMRSLEMTLQVVNITQNPEPLDFYNWNEIIPDVNAINGVPYRWLNALEEVMMIREGRAKAQADQQAIQAAPGAAALMNAQTKAAKA